MTTLYLILGSFSVVAGGLLLRELGAGRVPRPIGPIANVWVRAGFDLKWVTVAMWVVFAMMAFVLILFVGIPLYHAVLDLGTQRH